MSGIHTPTRTRPGSRESSAPGTERKRRQEGSLNILGAGNSAITGLLEGRDGGRPLDHATRAQMERSFGTPLGGVRVHDGPAARNEADRLGAAAFTHGSDIVLGSTARPDDRGLLAHELAHVVQQRRAGEMRPGEIDSPASIHETAANRAAESALEGRAANPVAGSAPAAIQRQPTGSVVVTQSPVEIAVEAFLRREWDAQSKSERPLKMTKSIRDAVDLVFSSSPLGSLAVASDLNLDPGTPDALMNRIRGKLPKSVPQRVLDVLDRMPTPDANKKPEVDKSPGSVKAPSFGQDAPKGGPPGKPPDLVPKEKTAEEKSKEEEDRYKDALGKAVEGFLATDVGKQLSEKVKEFALSKQGIPLTAIVIGGIVTFVAANDTKVPSVPAIPLGDGVELKFEYEGKISDLPPLLRKMAGKEPLDKPGATEVKVGVTLTVTDDEIVKFGKAVGRFFEVVGKGIAAGAVAVGTVVGKVVKTIWPELLAMAGGAGIGALIGGLVGGPLGAGIGAAIGAGVGLIGALIKRIFF